MVIPRLLSVMTPSNHMPSLEKLMYCNFRMWSILEPYSHSCVSSLQRPITTLCWGHRDSRLFLACGPALYIVRVEHRVASLQLLCQQGIATAVKEEKDVAKLTMPSRLCSYVTTAFVPTIKVTQDSSWLRSIKTMKHK